MSHAAGSIILCLCGKNRPCVKVILGGLLVIIMLAACSSSEIPAPTPQVQIVGEIATFPPSTHAPVITPTALPTPLPSSTPMPTLRAVVVSRVSEAIDPRLVTPIAEGAPLPDLTLTDVHGKTIHLREMTGRPLVLNFWTVGCGSCFYEFPLLQQFAEHHGADALAVISINIAELPAETRLIAEQLGVTFPVVVDAGAELFTTYFNGAVVPTTIFIRRDGTVAQVMTGPLDAYNLDLQLQALGLPAGRP